MDTQDTPLVSVVICTRNRGNAVLEALTAVLASNYPHFEVWVLDQSDTDATEAALDSLRQTDPRLSYRRIHTKGKPSALNVAPTLVRGSILALTDDDCEPDADWISALVAGFRAAPEVGCVFGDVAPGPHDPVKGYIPINRIAAAKTIFAVREYLQMPGLTCFGIGANMAVKREAVLTLGGWDPCIGPGTRFGSGDDHDLTVRLLKAGYAIHFTPSACVIHHGFRDWKDSGRNVERVAQGFGACFAKQLRQGTFYTGSFRLLTYFLRQIVWRLVTWQRPLGTRFPYGWLRGFVAGFRHPLNRAAGQFKTRPPTSSLSASHLPPQLRGEFSLALLTVVVTTLLRVLLNPWLRDLGAFSFYYVAITLCATRRGFRSALWCLAFSVLLADYFFIPPYFALGFSDSRTETKIVINIVVGLAIAYFSQRHQQQARERVL